MAFNSSFIMMVFNNFDLNDLNVSHSPYLETLELVGRGPPNPDITRSQQDTSIALLTTTPHDIPPPFQS